MIATYMQQHQDKGLIVAELPKQGEKDYEAQILSPPRSDRIVYHYAKQGGVVRVSKVDFMTWLKRSKEIQWSTVAKKFQQDLNAYVIKTRLGAGTKWELPRSQCIDMEIE